MKVFNLTKSLLAVSKMIFSSLHCKCYTVSLHEQGKTAHNLQFDPLKKTDPSLKKGSYL